MTKILSFLHKILGTYKEHGKGEVYFSCPFCHNRSPKFAINILNMAWHCWHCNAKGRSLITLCYKLDISQENINELRTLVTPEEIRKFKKLDEETSVEISLPKEFVPLWKPVESHSYRRALNYLLRRHITVTDIIRYNIGYCEHGEYANRVIVPSYDSMGKLNYFTGRSFYPDEKFRYKNPKVSKNVIIFENMINWSLPITLCEGMFDAISIKYNAIPLMGKILPKQLQNRLIEQKVSRVNMFLDPDAQTLAQITGNKLQALDIDVHNIQVPSGDAGDATQEMIWNSIESSEPITFKTLIKQKLHEVS